MQQLVYLSRAMDRLGPDEVFKIIETSARNNPTREITGFLVFSEGVFLQLVEGPAASLDALLCDLRSDPRHRDLEILESSAISERSFPNWRMERLLVANGDTSLLIASLQRAKVSRAMIDRIVAGFAQARAA